MKKINPIVRWWVTPFLPVEDIFAEHNFLTQWIIHPIKRRLARIYLKFLQKFTKIKVIGITGSTGKTTTTEILASILGKHGKTVWSRSGIDPVYNIPNTILRALPGTKYLILEMSVEFVGEMDFYLWLARPDIGVVTNISSTHTEFLESKDGVIREKGKLIKSLAKNSCAVLNADDKSVSALAKKTKARVVFFGKNADIRASKVKLNKDLSTDFSLEIAKGKKDVRIDAFGYQFVANSLPSSAVAHFLGISLNSIAGGIASFKRPAHRLNIFKDKKHGLIFDDSYNSNPKAATEALDTFKVVAGRRVKVAVVGDMLELGKLEEVSHRDFGKKIATMNFKYIIGVGRAARFIIEEVSKKTGSDQCFLVGDYKQAYDIVKEFINERTALFIKGSRSIHLDKLVDLLI